MSLIPYLTAAAGSSAVRIIENLYSVSRDTERYLNNEIGFKEATDRFVQHPYFYSWLTATKVVCDIIVTSAVGKWIYDVLSFMGSSFQGLLRCSFQDFVSGIGSSLKHFYASLGNCTLIISCATSGLNNTIQIELTKYWLECMGIIRAIAESLNIDFVTYMKKCSLNDIDMKSIFLSDKDQSLVSVEPQWKCVKDPDIIKVINVSLEDIFYGATLAVPLTRTIREIGKKEPRIEEVNFTVNIDPGCPDGKTFRFTEAGDRDPVNTPADLVVEVRATQHALYQRVGSDLIYVAKVSLSDALRGASIQIPLIDDGLKECDPKGVIKLYTQIIIDHAGLPDPVDHGSRGQLVIKFDIQFPDTKLGVEVA